jgi:hypothetical protein
VTSEWDQRTRTPNGDLCSCAGDLKLWRYGDGGCWKGLCIYAAYDGSKARHVRGVGKLGMVHGWRVSFSSHVVSPARTHTRRPGPMIFGARGETLSKGPFVIIIIIIRCTYI